MKAEIGDSRLLGIGIYDRFRSNGRGLKIVTDTIVGAPYYKYSVMGPNTLF